MGWAAESIGYIFIGAFSSWKQQCCLQGVGEASPSLLLCLWVVFCPVRWEVVEVAGGM